MTRRSLCRAELATAVADAVGNASDGIATFPLPYRSRSLNPSLDKASFNHLPLLSCARS